MTVTFHQRTASVSLVCDVPAATTHAIETLYAYDRRPAEAACRAEIRHTDRLDGIPLDGRQIEVGPSLTAIHQSDAWDDSFWVPAHSSLIRATPDRRRITVSYLDAPAAEHWAFRLVRQAMTAEMLHAGAVYAHSAAFAVDGLGVLILGHSGAGKTTLLLSALRHLAADYVTNDRSLLLPVEGTLMCLPWPARMRVGVGTLCASPELVGIALAAQGTADRVKVSIEPPDFSKLLNGGQVLTSCVPRLLVIPELLLGAHTSVEDVSPASAITMLGSTRLFMTKPGGGTSAHTNHWLFPEPGAHEAVVHRRIVVEASAKVPCYRLRFGGDPREAAAAIADLLERVP